ncbi:unnamed protein product [Prorocentrum cordatum]|uniref:Uncharacterized protein n=1 Tax=Prorocentrum cordatum TaxID=2364126 RepID=A0ABN9UE22_9DINO|nr:unnamed protein product [Polarella glacialis]
MHRRAVCSAIATSRGSARCHGALISMLPGTKFHNVSSEFLQMASSTPERLIAREARRPRLRGRRALAVPRRQHRRERARVYLFLCVVLRRVPACATPPTDRI